MRYFRKVKKMDGWHHQLMLERMQILQEALQRAEAHKETSKDWDIIYSECSMERKNEPNRI
jgi:hypothetical protein